MKLTILPATIEAVASRKDRTLKVTIGTQEVNADLAGTLFGMQGSFGYVALKPVEFVAQETEALEEMQGEFVDNRKRSASQRLRAVFYLMWQQNNEGFERFNSFYEAKMEMLIGHYKAKVE